MGHKIDFSHRLQIYQNLLSNFFLFRVYSFLTMLSISHEELDPIESPEGVRQTPIKTHIGAVHRCFE